MNRVDAVWAVGRLTIGSVVRLLTPLRNYGADRVPRTGGVVLAFNHFHWIDPPVFGLLLAAHDVLPRQGRGPSRAGARAADPELRDDLRPARRVRPRGGAADARGRARRSMRSVCSSRERASAQAPGPGSARRRDGRGAGAGARRSCRDLRLARVEARATSTRSRSPGASPFASTGCRRARRAIAKRRRRSSARIHTLHDWLAEMHAAGRPKQAVPPR